MSVANQSEFIVYVDESGDHGLKVVDPEFPLFVLACCVFQQSDYINSVVPSLQRLKFKHFGHDMVVLHEREIRKCVPPFGFLVDRARREDFMADLNRIVTESPFAIIACVVDKTKFAEKHGTDGYNPYHIALSSCLTRLNGYLQRRGENGPTHVVFEKRGKNEDTELELEFRRFVSVSKVPLEIVMAGKQVNSCGLQLADLVARPIGRQLLDGNKQSNRAFDILKAKLGIGKEGEDVADWFVDIFPGE